MNALINGAVAGLAATVPMTVAMAAMHKALPDRERYPLPPRQIVENVTDKAGLGDELEESHETALTYVSHFGYGAAAGAIYGEALKGLDINPTAANGVVFGLGVWAGSYLGLLPAIGLLDSATGHPARRNALMIAAHVVWGAALGVAAGGSASNRNENGRTQD